MHKLKLSPTICSEPYLSDYRLMYMYIFVPNEAKEPETNLSHDLVLDKYHNMYAPLGKL